MIYQPFSYIKNVVFTDECVPENLEAKGRSINKKPESELWEFFSGPWPPFNNYQDLFYRQIFMLPCTGKILLKYDLLIDRQIIRTKHHNPLFTNIYLFYLFSLFFELEYLRKTLILISSLLFNIFLATTKAFIGKNCFIAVKLSSEIWNLLYRRDMNATCVADKINSVY